MLRITCVPESESMRLKVEGRLVSAEVGLLEATVARELAKREPLVIDLSGVTFIDRDGVGFLRGILTDEVTLSGASLFVGEMIRE